MLDALDRQIIHLLTIEPRASFRTIAEVTGISDQTAARRYRKLCEDAGLRVLGVPDGSRLGWTDWFVRLQTTPGGADSIAEALARRPDTRWVHLASGGTEIICTLQARTEEQRDALFLRGLPGSRRVVQISAHSILHHFNPGPWREATRALSPAQLEKLALLAGGTTPQTPPIMGGCPPPIPPGGRLPAPPYPSGPYPPGTGMSRCWPSWPATAGRATPRSPRRSTGTSQLCGAGSTSSGAPGWCISRWMSTTGFRA
jgi:DNA-binding Lrp family transcriptional regulator